MNSLQHSIIGLPGSGKTTFLAALWHLLNAEEVPCKFALDKLVGDHTHLNTIVEAWRKCDEVPRTSMAAEEKVSIYVKEIASGQKAILHFPDLSGESFERQLDTRTCTTDYLDSIESNGGILLFVTADRQTDGMAIVDLSSMMSGDDVQEQNEEHHEWEPKMVSTQVNIVGLLQFLQHVPFRHILRRIAVIVSAWDVIDAPDLKPETWLERELPLLHQFLISNPSSFEFQIYGVSAQGGNVKSGCKDDLLQKTPSTRISCIGPDTDPHDLTSPIAWLMTSE